MNAVLDTNGIKYNTRKKLMIVNVVQIPAEFCFLSLKIWFCKMTIALRMITLQQNDSP